MKKTEDVTAKEAYKMIMKTVNKMFADINKELYKNDNKR